MAHHSSTLTQLITSLNSEKNDKNLCFYSQNLRVYGQNSRFYSRQLSWVEGEMMMKFFRAHAHWHQHMLPFALNSVGEEAQNRPPWQL